MTDLKSKFLLTFNNESNFDDICLEVWYDKEKIFDKNASVGTFEVTHTISDDDLSHSIEIILKNKNVNNIHTVVDQDGNIVSDVLIVLDSVWVDDFDVTQVFYENSYYLHDTNSNDDMKKHAFFGPMGCNGSVVFNFTLPFYIWLMENI